MKNLCSGEYPSRPVRARSSAERVLSKAMKASRKPPLSAVLSQREVAVEFHTLGCFKAGVFVRNALFFFVKFFSIFRSPPIAKVTGAIEFPALVVETVGQLVSNNGADCPEIRGVIRLSIEQRNDRVAG